MNHELALSFVAALHQVVEERKKLQNLEVEIEKNLKQNPDLAETFIYRKQIDTMNLQYDICLRRTQQLDRQIEQLQTLLGPQIQEELLVEYNGVMYIISADPESSLAFCVKHKQKGRLQER
jgi:hypothetical protein